jgi:hypothetical protein
MSDYATMKIRICDELSRPQTEIADFVGLQIKRAIEHYTPERFGFNERLLTWTLSSTAAYLMTTILANNQMATTEEQESYGVEWQKRKTSDIIEVDWVTVNHSSNRQYDLEPLPFASMVRLRTTPIITGNPSYYSIFDNKLWLDTIPDATITAQMYAHVSFIPADLQEDQSNPWFVEGYNLIAARAARMTLQLKLDDFEKAQVYAQVEKEALDSLRERAGKRTASGRLVGSW